MVTTDVSQNDGKNCAYKKGPPRHSHQRDFLPSFHTYLLPLLLNLRPSGWVRTICPLFGLPPFVGPYILRSTLSLVAEAFPIATTLVFSLIVLSLSADLISLTEPDTYFKFSALALATSLLSLLTVGPMCDQTFVAVGFVTKSTFIPSLYVGCLSTCIVAGHSFRSSLSRFRGCVSLFFFLSLVGPISSP